MHLHQQLPRSRKRRLINTAYCDFATMPLVEHSLHLLATRRRGCCCIFGHCSPQTVDTRCPELLYVLPGLPGTSKKISEIAEREATGHAPSILTCSQLQHRAMRNELSQIDAGFFICGVEALRVVSKACLIYADVVNPM